MCRGGSGRCCNRPERSEDGCATLQWRLMLRNFLLTLLTALALWSAETTPAKKSALDKATLEAYVRHVFVWNSQIKVDIGNPKPSPLVGFFEVEVHATQGNASADETLYVSKDGQKILRGSVFDVTENPFKPQLAKLHTDLQPSMGTPGAPVVIAIQRF